MNKLWHILFLSLLFTQVAFADSEAGPEPMVSTSRYGSAYFTMLPQSAHHKEAFGVAYTLQEDGTSKELWRVHGWYAFKVYLSESGEYLVRMGNWSRGRAPSKEDLAVAFYKNGLELKSYATVDLVKNTFKVKRTFSHYMWQAYDEAYPRLSYDGIFHLKTIDGIEYRFDIKTGLLVEN